MMSKNPLSKPIVSRRNISSFAIPIALGVLWLSSCAAPPMEEDAASNSIGNSVGNRSTPAKSIAPTPTPPTQGFSYRIFVPNANAALSPQIVRDTDARIPTNYEDKAERVLKLLFPKLEFLPQGTRLLEDPYMEENGVVRLNLSKQFLQLNKLPETPVLLTLDAISKTLGAFEINNGKIGGAAKVRFLAEGKIIRTLSEFSLEEAWKASEQDEDTSRKPGGGT